jgi:hypothetical protein
MFLSYWKNWLHHVKKEANKFIHYLIFPISSIVLFNQYPSICELKGTLQKVHLRNLIIGKMLFRGFESSKILIWILIIFSQNSNFKKYMKSLSLQNIKF